MTTTVTARIQLKRKTAAVWTSENPILLIGEMGWESDTNKMKVGNGASTWNLLPYLDIVDVQSIIDELAGLGVSSDEVKDFRAALGLTPENFPATATQFAAFISALTGPDLAAVRAALVTQLGTASNTEATTLLGMLGNATTAGLNGFFDDITPNTAAGEVVSKAVGGGDEGIALEPDVQPTITELIAGTTGKQAPDPETLRTARTFASLSPVSNVIEFNPNTMINRHSSITASVTLKFIDLTEEQQTLSGFIDIINSNGGAKTITLSSGGVGYSTVVRMAGTTSITIGSTLGDVCRLYWEAQKDGVIEVSQKAYAA